MAKRKPILIGCPQYSKLVRGSYLCGPDGNYRLSPDGTFLVHFVKCGHDGGRCMQTLCVLHRYNRQGTGSWYPSKLLAAPERRHKPRAHRPKRRRKPPRDGSTDVLA